MKTFIISIKIFAENVALLQKIQKHLEVILMRNSTRKVVVSYFGYDRTIDGHFTDNNTEKTKEIKEKVEEYLNILTRDLPKGIFKCEVQLIE